MAHTNLLGEQTFLVRLGAVVSGRYVANSNNSLSCDKLWVPVLIVTKGIR